MVTSDLHKIGRVVNLDDFVIRVQAAMLLQASVTPLGGSLTEPKNLAIWVLKNPMVEERSMVALVAADPTVLAQIGLTEDGTAAVLTNVTDDAIKAVVAARWALVATKYPVPAP